MKKLLKSTLMPLIVLLAAMPATAQDHHMFNHLGVGVHAATTGFGFELATPVTKFLTVRAGMSIMPSFSFGTDLDGTCYDSAAGIDRNFTMHADAGLKRTQGSVILNVYPFAHFSSFYVAAGAYFGGADILKITGTSDDLRGLRDAYVEIGDYELPVDEDGSVRGSLRAKSFRPYLGLGFGRPVPKGRLSFGVELGVQFMGRMKVYNHDRALDELIEGNDDDWQKWMDKLKVYPVLKFTLSGRIF